jgi:hypothetical protein
MLFLGQWSSSCIQHTELARLVDIGFLKEDYTSEWAKHPHQFQLPKRMELYELFLTSVSENYTLVYVEL